MNTENTTSEAAKQYIKNNTQDLIEIFITSNCSPEKEPVSIFMAGSPGAGKTEFAKRLIERFDGNVVHIDADAIKEMIPQYSGKNSDVVQGAASIGVEKLHDHVLKNNYTFILDTTFSNKEKGEENIQRSLKRNRKVEIFYLYQDPIIAWGFAKRREKVEGRYMPQDAFIEAFFASKENVEYIKDTYKKQVTVNVIEKNYQNELKKLYLNVNSVDSYINITYTREDLESALNNYNYDKDV